MQGGTVVSRNDIFNSYDDDNDQEVYSGSYNSGLYGNFEFEEVDMEQNQPAAESDKPPETSDVVEFQLFANSGPTQIDLQAKPQQIEQSRPLSYYFFSLTENEALNIKKSAISGNDVLSEAQFWADVVAQRHYVAPDVNADFVPKKKKCRPGKSARASRRQRKETIEKRGYQEELAWHQRRNQKPRIPLRIPSQISPTMSFQKKSNNKNSGSQPESRGTKARKLGHRIIKKPNKPQAFEFK